MGVNLQVLYASNNKIDKWPEVERLQTLPKLRELNLVNNPIFQKADAEGNWRIEVIKRLEKLKSLDGSLIEDEERERQGRGLRRRAVSAGSKSSWRSSRAPAFLHPQR